MEGYEKEPVPEFQCPAKCDRRNDQVGDAREEWVIGMGRVESIHRRERDEINPVGFLCSDEDSPGREYNCRIVIVPVGLKVPTGF